MSGDFTETRNKHNNVATKRIGFITKSSPTLGPGVGAILRKKQRTEVDSQGFAHDLVVLTEAAE